MTRFRWGLTSHVGRVRAANQDSALAIEGFFVVADGMGGHRGGEVASAIAVKSLSDSLPLLSTDEVMTAIRSSNDAVLERANGDPALRGMGTTLCVLALVDDDDAEEPLLALANIGDSRIYQFASGVLERMTDDHSVVAEMMRQGRITASEAETHPQRNVLTRALGIEPNIEIDAWRVRPVVGDRWLLCSDGLFNEVSEATIAEVLGAVAEPSAAADELVRLANEGGGRDNTTVLIVDVVDDDGHAVIASTPISGELPALAAARRRVPDGGADETAGAPPSKRASTALRQVKATWRVTLFVAAIVALVLVAVITWLVTRHDGASTQVPASTSTTVTVTAPPPTSTAVTVTSTPPITTTS